MTEVNENKGDLQPVEEPVALPTDMRIVRRPSLKHYMTKPFEMVGRFNPDRQPQRSLEEIVAEIKKLLGKSI